MAFVRSEKLAFRDRNRMEAFSPERYASGTALKCILRNDDHCRKRCANSTKNAKYL